MLQDIASQEWQITHNLSRCDQTVFTGRKTPAFTTAYVGTVDLACGHRLQIYRRYRKLDVSKQNVALSNTAAKAFSVRYPTLKYNWYITYEANLGAFWNDAVKITTPPTSAAYVSLSAVKSGKTFM